MTAGARCGPAALAVFSCTGRGESVFVGPGVDADGGDCEARVIDEALAGEMPFIGAYCNGEIGPHVCCGYAGWSRAAGGIAQEDKGSAGRSLGGDPLNVFPRSKATSLGYTTVLSGIS